MSGLLTALTLLVLGGVAAAVGGRRARLATVLGGGGATLAAVVGIPASIRLLAGSHDATLMLPGIGPFASFRLDADPLSALFLLPAFGVSALAAIHGAGHRFAVRGRPAPGWSWLTYDLLVAAGVLVVLGRSAAIVLCAGELLLLCTFGLLALEAGSGGVRRAGWLRAGVAQVAVLAPAAFLLAGDRSGMPAHLGLPFVAGAAPTADRLLLPGVVGFGAAAVLALSDAWFPDPQASVPAHASVLVSTTMIGVGSYGLVRILTLSGGSPWWWGSALLCAGGTAALVAGLLAVTHPDLRRVVDAATVQQAGVIAAALGLGLLGIHGRSPLVAFLGFSAGLVQVLNHALSRTLLGLSAAAVEHATSTTRLAGLGGLYGRMRDTGATMLTGALSAAGLPPSSGLPGMLLLCGAALAALTGGPAMAVPAALLLVLLALAGALGVVASARAFGGPFLGRPRGAAAAAAHEVPPAMRVPMHLGTAACGILGVFPLLLLLGVARPAVRLAASAGPGVTEAVDAATLLLHWAGGCSLALFVGALIVGAAAWWLGRPAASLAVDPAPGAPEGVAAAGPGR